MEQIVILHPNGLRLPLFSREKNSAISKATQKVALLSDDVVNLTVTSAVALPIKLGDMVEVYGKIYKINQLPQPTKDGERKLTYEITLEGKQYDLIDVAFKLPEGCYGEQLYADLAGHMNALMWNIGRIFPNKWVLGACPTGTKFKNISGEGKNCLQVLQELCSEYGVEFAISRNATTDVCTLDIKAHVGTTFPIALYYGRGKGLYKLQRKNVNNAGVTTRLYVYGGSQNLGTGYGHTRLCLPNTTRLSSYIQDATAVELYGIKEGEKNFDDIKPQRVGTVTALGSNNISFVDSSMFNLNEREQDGTTTKYLIPGNTAKITFLDGQLGGYSFDVHSYNHETHTFVINKFTDENGMVFPADNSAAFQITIGDKYIIEDITLPQSYIDAAEAELSNEGAKELQKLCQPQVSYALQLDEAFMVKTFGRDLPTEVLSVGDSIRIVDTQVGVDKEVRITAIERDLLRRHTYNITLSDTVTKSNTIKVINSLNEINETIHNNGLADPIKARRRWKTAQELLSMVFDPDGDYYSEKIKPLSIETKMLAVGAKSQQFMLKNVLFEPNLEGRYYWLKISGGTLIHYAIDDTQNVEWTMAANNLIELDTSSAYYIYAKCSKTTTAGTWQISTQQIAVEAQTGYYTFLVGTISSPQTIPGTLQAVRSISLTYGFSTVNGRFIRTGRIESTAGNCYFDLDNNMIGGIMQFVRQDGTTCNVTDLEAKADETKNYIDNTLPGVLSDLQAQIDGQIEQFFYDYDPDNSTEPTATWIATDTAAGNDNEKEAHLGDLFYNTDTGKVFRYVKNQILTPAPFPGAQPGHAWVYNWQELSDAEVAEALAIANDALDLAKTKRRIFTTTPYTPYEVGDLWVQGTSGDIMRCKTTRLTGSYTSTDWERASKYTDDTALTTFINGTYATNYAGLLNQIDGKIETWFQATDPSTTWTSYERALQHVGDLWYNTTTKRLYRWENTEADCFAWLEVQNKDAIDALAAAAQAQDTADGKRRVFVTQPYAPYDVGDLWLTGDNTNGLLKRCITARAAGASPAYVANEWVEAVYYDNTKTTIDGGLVTSGTVQLVSPVSESIVAGITGGENETAQTAVANKVRIWAGASRENRFTAPFRVLQDGTLHATKANIEGTIKATDGEFRGKVYATDGEFAGRIYIGNGAIRLEKDGSGSLGNGQITWQADYGSLTVQSLTINQLWGYNALAQILNNTIDMLPSASLFHLNLPTNETINLTTTPQSARMYTFINESVYQKTFNGNGRKIWFNGREFDSLSIATWQGANIQAKTITFMFEGKWYVVAYT